MTLLSSIGVDNTGRCWIFQAFWDTTLFFERTCQLIINLAISGLQIITIFGSRLLLVFLASVFGLQRYF